jgi:hypothetical protein
VIAAAEEVTGLDILTLAVAIAGAITGVVALVMQNVFFRNSGPRVRCALKGAWVHRFGAGALTFPMDRGFGAPPEPEYDRPMFAVEVRNRGRAATTVDQVLIDLPDGTAFRQPAPDIGPACPHRLEAEASETWYLDPQPIITAAQVFKIPPDVRAVVVLGSGRSSATKRYPLRLRPH